MPIKYYESKRFQRECVVQSDYGGFNGNQGEFFHTLIYNVGIALNLDGIRIKQQGNMLAYDLYGNLLPQMGSMQEYGAALLNSAMGLPDPHHNEKMAEFHFGIRSNGFNAEVKGSEMYSDETVVEALDNVVETLDREMQLAVR